ncbi:glycosyltransferase, partial [Candidatus Parcubacteria bacterium]|nr:glycosyltransferase [Candidatus Parcubacteria bacterium]
TGLEAAGFSKPVVAFDVGGISQWLEDGQNGFLVEPQSREHLTEKISLLLEDKSLARRMGQVGKKRLQEKFTLERHLDKLEKVLANKV